MIYAKRNILFQITSKLAKKLGFVGTIIKVFDSLHHKLFILKLQTSYLGFQESRGVLLTLFDLKSAAELPEVQILDAITELILVSVIVAKFRYQVPADVSRIFDRLQETLNLVSTPKIRVSESRRIFQNKEFLAISF